MRSYWSVEMASISLTGKNENLYDPKKIVQAGKSVNSKRFILRPHIRNVGINWFLPYDFMLRDHLYNFGISTKEASTENQIKNVCW